MKKSLIMLFASILFLSSCNRNEIRLNDVFGTYKYIYHDSDPKWDLLKHVIIINSDTTYFHTIYHKDTLLVDEHGTYNFNRFVPGIQFYNFTAYNKYLYETQSKREYFTFIIKRNIFGQIYLSFNWPFDPDGAPIRPKYKKVK